MYLTDFLYRDVRIKNEIIADSVSIQGSADVDVEVVPILSFRLPVGRTVLCPDGLRIELTTDKKLSCVNEFSKNGKSDRFKISAL